MNYTQCKLSRATRHGVVCQVCWIPECFAVPDSSIKLHMDDRWVVWQVDAVYDARICEQEAREIEHRWKLFEVAT